MQVQRLIAPVAFVVAIGAGAAISGPIVGTAEASGCSADSHVTYSKYSGTYCMPDTNQFDKVVFNIVGGCVIGIFGGTIITVAYGCGAGVVGAITGSIE